MARKKTKCEYKKVLHNFLGGKMWNTKVFSVHHINHDHNDNRVENLLLMPKRMHNKYHYLHTFVQRTCLSKMDLDLNLIWQQETVREFVDIKVDMCCLLQSQYEVRNMRRLYALQGVEFDGVSMLMDLANEIYGKYI